MDNSPVIETERTRLVVLRAEQAVIRHRYVMDNRRFLEPWEPIRPPSYYTREDCEKRLEMEWQQYQKGMLVHFCALNHQGTEMLAMCNFSNIVQGVFQACHLGYSVAEKRQGQGLMAEVLKAGIEYMFEVRRLHRIMANYMPSNERSGKLLERLGFEREGYARSYLKINGHWEDHVLTALITVKV